MSKVECQREVALYAILDEYSDTGYHLTVASVAGGTPDGWIELDEVSACFRYEDCSIIEEMIDQVQEEAVRRRAEITANEERLLEKLRTLPPPKES